MSISIQMVLVARYDKKDKLWRSYVKHVHGDDDYKDFTGEGMSPDEARGHLLREMILAGLSKEMVFLDVETEEISMVAQERLDAVYQAGLRRDYDYKPHAN